MEEVQPDPIATVQIKETTPSRSKRRLFYLSPPVEQRPAFWRRLAYEIPLAGWLGYHLVGWSINGQYWNHYLPPSASDVLYWTVLPSLPACWIFLALSRANWWHYLVAPIWLLGVAILDPLFYMSH
ncbi:MAG: hypothetical protein IH944_01335 [Armatimonadetes bacterium]|nr:hypothetical protein [Armatimonadota bacterium]